MRPHFLLLFIALLFTDPIVAQSASQEPFYDSVDAFLGAHVRAGRVDYTAIKKQPDVLDALLKTIAEADRTSLAPADDKAFLVNA
jgi:hypothetical protein